MGDIKSYRKKPLVISAVQHTSIEDTTLALMRLGVWWTQKKGQLGIQNPGTMKWLKVELGDYIVIAPTGCRYPVKADQFERNYDPV